MDNLPNVKKGTIIKKVEKSLFVHKEDQQSLNAQSGIRARKLLKPLPPAKQIEAEALAAKIAREQKEKEERQKEENATQDHIKLCDEVYRVAFEYNIKLTSLFDDMINNGMGTEISKIFEGHFYPKLEQLMRKKLDDLEKQFFVTTLLDSNVVKLTKNQLCGVVAKNYFKSVGNLQWKGMENYEGDEATLKKIDDLIKRKLVLAERIREVRRNK